MTAYPNSYATLAQFKRRIGIPDSSTNQDADLQDKLDSATEDINRWCGRAFWTWTVASERTFTAGPSGIDVDDFWTTDGLLLGGVPYAVGGSYALEPANGIQDGVPGWPYRRLAYPAWPTGGWLHRSSLVLTAKWGWAGCPKSVVTACMLIAAMDNKSGDAPFGVAGFGDYAIRIRANPMAEEKLRPYIKEPVKIAT